MEVKLMRRHKTSTWKILYIFKSITIARGSYMMALEEIQQCFTE